MFKTLLLGVSLALAVPAVAQEAKPALRENTDAVHVDYYKFKAGTDERRQAIEKLFDAAAKASGTAFPTVIHLMSGPWDAIYIFTLKSGFDDLNYSVGPEEAKWVNALAAANGGMAKAQALREEWNAMVERSSSEIGHIHRK